MGLKVELCQFRSEVGNIKGNVERIIQLYNEFDADLIVFPELSLTGYNCKDLFINRQFLTAVKKYISQIIPHIGEKAIIIGTPKVENNNLYNSALLIQNGQIKYKYHKYFLPNYGVFDEKRYFKSGDKLSSIFQLQDCKIRLMICEDIWHQEAKLDREDEICDLTLIINASPYSISKKRKRVNLVKFFSKKYNSGVAVYLNSVGGEDNLIFDGNSFVVKNGELVSMLDSWKEEKITLNLGEKTLITKANHQFFDSFEEIADESKKWQSEAQSDIFHLNNQALAEIYNGIILSLREYSHYSNCNQVVIGLSGGIDSALVAVLAVAAFGPENVLCIAMPSEYSSKSSIDDAADLVKKLHCRLEIIPINSIKMVFHDALNGILGRLKIDEIASENIQPRIRSTLLMAVANRANRLLLCTSNKSESAVGYTTIYGDMTGAYAPIGDLYKTQIYSLSRWINRLGNIIPNSIIEKTPSAELKPYQKDSDSLPQYDILDEILYKLIELGEEPQDELELQIGQMIYQSEFKRFQAPPAPKINDVMLNFDRRYTICHKF